MAPQKLAQFTRDVNNFHWPMSYKITNPGPKAAPQVKQPNVLIMQWKDGKETPLNVGPNKDGWIPGF